MHRKAVLFLLLGMSAVTGAAQNEQLVPDPPRAAAVSSPVAGAIAQWNALRQSDNNGFTSYASFLTRYRGWPGEAGLRRSAERRLATESVSPNEVIRFFTMLPPTTAGGQANYALALQAAGRTGEARDAARRAWRMGAMGQSEESRLLGAFGGVFTPDDHDARLETLLGNGDTASAARAIGWARAARRPVFEAQLALQRRDADASARLAALDAAAARDPGLLIDRAYWLRNSNQSAAARALLANRPRFERPPVNPARYIDIALILARGAANDRNWQTAYRIAASVEDLYAPGTDVSDRPYGERDDYTSLVWLGGQTALYRLNRPREAARLFVLYAGGARTPQTRAKGYYWAARAAAQAGQQAEANAWLQRAASSPDQFYGLLAMERLGQVPRPPAASPPPDAATRAAFARRPLAEATRYLGMVGRRSDQGLFVRALAESLETEQERVAAAQFGRDIGRPDLGVWVQREARNRGENFYDRGAFPEVQIPAAYSHNWAAAHGIIRQESSFERTAVSHVGARGMMQLMPGTAAAEARRVGVPYSLGRLTEDASYNVLLGSAHLTMLMDRFGNNLVLVAVAYNAGIGRVPQWINANGDPRLPGADMLRWIEEIPFSETRGYVQRVVENAMVYDLMHPERSRSRGRISYYLGQNALR
ncbi:MAG TPA: lytic transglycosylase domain-containing protein [Allosphingosinicella sp.]|nr:lytic transglycosylase domain-containing protein [Allosphingosinicella sp.]